MPDIMIIIRNAFFAGFVCIGLAILRNVERKYLLRIYIRGSMCSAFFVLFNLSGHSFVGGFVGSLCACAIVYALVQKREINPLLIIIPSLYGITPGSALYNMFLGLLSGDIEIFKIQLIYIVYVTAGILIGMKSADVIRTASESKKSKIKR